MYRNFHIVTYPHATYLYQAELEDVRAAIAYFGRHLPLAKVYLETHRGNHDIAREKMLAVKNLFLENGIQVGGAICPTLHLEGHEKNNFYDALCFTDPALLGRFLELVRYTAELFDEILLDDFFFTNCRCELCIDAKGDRSWGEYRTALMEMVSHKMREAAESVNPGCKLIIKFPNWYEGYRESGYHPEGQRDIFDKVYTGVEARNPKYDPQHIQRYLSYSNYRRISNLAPGKNAGAWFDEGGSNDNGNVWLEQAELALFAGAQELTVCRDWLSFPHKTLVESPIHPALGQALKRVDAILDRVGKPVGVPVYEPFEGKGEGQLLNYLGMVGIPFEPVPEFPAGSPSVFLPASAAGDPEIVQKLKAYLRQGGFAVVTSGFLEAVQGRGMDDVVPYGVSPRSVAGSEFWTDSYSRDSRVRCAGSEPVEFPVMSFGGGAFTEAGLITGEFCCPILTETHYGRGTLYALAVPNDYSKLYRLPGPVLSALSRVFTRGLGAYLRPNGKCSLFLYDNGVLGVMSHRPHEEDLQVVVRGGRYKGLRDVETGEAIPVAYETAGSKQRFDAARAPQAEREQVVSVRLQNGAFRFFESITE